MQTPHMSSICQRFPIAKRLSKKSLDALAKSCGFSSRQALAQWIKSPQRVEEARRIERLANAMNVSPCWLAGWERDDAGINAE